MYTRETELLLAALDEAYTAIKTHPDPRARQEAPAGKIGIVTAADLLIDEKIIQRIQAEWPDDGILSEESGWRTPQSGQRTWIIDPLDGSKEFHNGIPECGICVALHDGNDIVLAAVKNPVNGQCFFLRDHAVLVDGLPARPAGTTDLKDATISVSRSEHKRGWWDDFGLRTEPVGSIAWKIVQVACGDYEGTITYTPKYVWDIAAAVAIARAAGCLVLRGDGEPFTLPVTDQTVTSGLIVAAPGIATALRAHAVPWIQARPADQMDAR